MENILCTRDLINLWPTRKALAEDMNRMTPTQPVSVAQCHKWSETQSIPAKHHYTLIQCGQARGFPITAELLVQLHAPSERGAALSGASQGDAPAASRPLSGERGLA